MTEAPINNQGAENKLSAQRVANQLSRPPTPTTTGGGILSSRRVNAVCDIDGSDLVGTAGFEPATPCTPCKCATRLRHAPSAKSIQRLSQTATDGLARDLELPRAEPFPSSHPELRQDEPRLPPESAALLQRV